MNDRVHNHPPYRPACNERRLSDGQLRGACLDDDGTSLTAARGERPADIILHDRGGPLVENLPGKWDKAKVERTIAHLLGRSHDAE